jgi:hypothetical protein
LNTAAVGTREEEDVQEHATALAGIKKICRRSRQQLARSKRKTEKANWYWDQILIFRSQNIRYYYQK